jgi:hypothetical protein
LQGLVAKTVPSDFQARRAQRLAARRSAWNLPLILFAVIGVGGTWVGLVELLLLLRVQFRPPDAFLFDGTRWGNIVTHVIPIFPAIAAGLIFGNVLVWLIPPARRALMIEGPHGTTFKSSNLGLAKFLIVLLAIATPIGIVGATRYFYLTPSRICYRPSWFNSVRSYQWMDVRGIETNCWHNRSVQFTYTLLLSDGTRLGILEASENFFHAYPALSSALSPYSYDFTYVGNPACLGTVSNRLRLVLANRPSPLR